MNDIKVPPPNHVHFDKSGRAYADMDHIIDTELERINNETAAPTSYTESCKCPAPGIGKEYRCDDESGSAFPSHCPCACHKENQPPSGLERLDGSERPSGSKYNTDFTEQARCPSCGHSEISGKSMCGITKCGATESGVTCDCDNEFHWWKPFEKEARELVIHCATTLGWNKIDTATLIERIRVFASEAATAALEQAARKCDDVAAQWRVTAKNVARADDMVGGLAQSNYNNYANLAEDLAKEIRALKPNVAIENDKQEDLHSPHG